MEKPKSRTTARAAPPPPSHRRELPDGSRSAVVPPAVVRMVSEVVALPPEERVTLLGFKLQVGRLCAPAGEVVSLQATFIVPEYVLPAFSVTVTVALPPGDTADGDCADITTLVTVTVAVPVAAA